MTKDQKTFLTRRLRVAVKAQPKLTELKRLLLKIGGDFLVAPPRPDSDLTSLLRSGFVMHGPVTLNTMATSACHQNAAAIWRSRKSNVIGIATGYALSRDGLWRQHSWVVLRDGLLETTVKRTKYFGILLQDSHADRFAKSNSG
jgi:hypothetical protein